MARRNKGYKKFVCYVKIDMSYSVSNLIKTVQGWQKESKTRKSLCAFSFFSAEDNNYIGKHGRKKTEAPVSEKIIGLIAYGCISS